MNFARDTNSFGFEQKSTSSDRQTSYNKYLMYPMAENFFQSIEKSQDFASLPPTANLLGDLESCSTDLLSGELFSDSALNRSFRFSEPCLVNPSDNNSKKSSQNGQEKRTGMSQKNESKVFETLMEQINLLHETNKEIYRNLRESKVDIEALKHKFTQGMRKRTDSWSALSTQSQPMFPGGRFGLQSPASTSSNYTPGAMTDVVSEIKEASRVREDALLERIKSMVEERQWALHDTNFRIMRDLEAVKAQVQLLRDDHKKTNERLTQLEIENKYMQQMLNAFITPRANMQNNLQANMLPQQALKNCAPRQHPKLLNLNYGTIHHQPTNETLAEPLGSLHNNESLALNDEKDDNGFCFSRQTTNNHAKSQMHVKNEARNDMFPIGDQSLNWQNIEYELNAAAATRREADERIRNLQQLVQNLHVNASSACASSQRNMIIANNLNRSNDLCDLNTSGMQTSPSQNDDNTPLVSPASAAELNNASSVTDL